MPDTMRSQLGLICEGLTAFDIPMITKEGFEADDIIGTISKRASAGGSSGGILFCGAVCQLSFDGQQMQLLTGHAVDLSVDRTKEQSSDSSPIQRQEHQCHLVLSGEGTGC